MSRLSATDSSHGLITIGQKPLDLLGRHGPVCVGQKYEEALTLFDSGSQRGPFPKVGPSQDLEIGDVGGELGRKVCAAVRGPIIHEDNLYLAVHTLPKILGAINALVHSSHFVEARDNQAQKGSWVGHQKKFIAELGSRSIDVASLWLVAFYCELAQTSDDGDF